MKSPSKFVSSACVAFCLLVAAALVGCEGTNDNKAVTDSTPRTQSTASAQPSAKEVKTAAVTKEAQPAPAQAAPAAAEAQPVSQTAAVETSEVDPELENKRLQTQNLIYARIRIKMEELIAERAKLLKEGKDPTDPQIRQIEGQIMRARDLLQENGEVVDEIDPPIVNKVEK
jgi:hypothetical protein